MTTSGGFIYCRLVALYHILRSSTGSPASSPDLPASPPRVDLPEADCGAHVDCGHSSIVQPSGSPHPYDNQRSTASSQTCHSGDVIKSHSASVDRSRYRRSVSGCQAGEEAFYLVPAVPWKGLAHRRAFPARIIINPSQT
jgi:hypothetical protein